MFNGIRSILPAIVVIVFFATVGLPEGDLLGSERHQSQGNQVLSPPREGNSPTQVKGDSYSNYNGEISATALSQELKTREDPSFDTPGENVPGPGAFLGTILRQLTTASAESDDRIKKLFAGIPQVLPDLNKVLTAL
jgi:hypothetical protein